MVGEAYTIFISQEQSRPDRLWYIRGASPHFSYRFA
jgi:hypothetical protein